MSIIISQFKQTSKPGHCRYLELDSASQQPMSTVTVICLSYVIIHNQYVKYRLYEPIRCDPIWDNSELLIRRVTPGLLSCLARVIVYYLLADEIRQEVHTIRWTTQPISNHSHHSTRSRAAADRRRWQFWLRGTWLRCAGADMLMTRTLNIAAGWGTLCAPFMGRCECGVAYGNAKSRGPITGSCDRSPNPPRDLMCRCVYSIWKPPTEALKK